jgi:hypothetical protein
MTKPIVNFRNFAKAPKIWNVANDVIIL